MATFGNRPEDSVTDSKGNVRPDVVITVFASQADAISNRNSIGSESTGADGRWPIDLSGRTVVWAREPNGSVWSVASDTALSDHETRLDTVETELPNKLEAADISGKADVTYVDTGLAAKVDTATADVTYETGAARIVYVSPGGNDARSGKTWNTAKATIAAALTEMGTSKGTIVLDNGTHNVGATLAWPSTATCGMVGQGRANTFLQATGQTGPLHDLTAVGYGLNGAVFGGFTLTGDGTSGTAKKGLALSSTVSVVGATFHDIAVTGTGGAPFDLGMAELCSFDRLLADAPVGVDTNDVPYLMATGAFNGNTISRLCLSANVANPGTGLSGAVVIKDNGSTTPHDNKITDVQIQGLRVITGSTIFAIAGNANVISDIQMFDAGKVAGATGTSVARFTPPAVTDLGGNLMRGVIPGKGTDTTSFDTGIDMRQSRNRVEGVKGYRGTNVTLASGVGSTYVRLGGSASAAIDPGVVDNSGVTTNTIIDDYLSLTKRGKRTYQQGTATADMDLPGGAWGGGVRFSDPNTPANGLLGLGTTGSRLSAAGGVLTVTTDNFVVRNIATTNAFGIATTGAIGVSFFGTTLPAATSALRGRVSFVQGATGVADQLYICRKNAADTYEWAPLV